MKKLFLLLFITSLVIADVNAQLSINPEAGINLSTASWKIGDIKSDTESQLSPKVGAVIDLAIYKGFYIQPGIFYSVKGVTVNNTQSGISSKNKITLNYIEIPFNLAYRYDFGQAGALFVAVGPYLGIGLDGKNKTTIRDSSSMEDDIHFGDAGNEFKKLDYGVNLGIGYISPIGIYLRLQYGMGFSNLSNIDNSTWKNRTYSASLGYTFMLNEK